MKVQSRKRKPRLPKAQLYLQKRVAEICGGAKNRKENCGISIRVTYTGKNHRKRYFWDRFGNGVNETTITKESRQRIKGKQGWFQRRIVKRFADSVEAALR